MPGYKFFKDATNNFSMDQKLGSGRWGDVYKAHLPTGEVVAVRVLYETGHDESDEQHLSQVFTELMSANHKNLVKVLGYSCERQGESLHYKGIPIFAESINGLIGFEYVPGGSLAKFFSDQYLIGVYWDIRFKIIKGICDGLQYLHEAGIMHFDLHPDNILLDDEKVPKITDYGLAMTFREAHSSLGFTGMREYSPPEFISRLEMSKEYDIFSLGVLIKKIVTGIMDYSSVADMDGRECVEHVHKTWRRRLQEIRRYPSFEADCQQVRTCIEIAVACTKRDPRERPLMKDIIRELYEVETRGNYTSSQIEQGIHDYEVRKFSLKELEHITGNFSEKLGQDGFSAVYKGKFEYGEVIAVKRFDKRLRKPEQQFEKVVNIVKLEHKNIVRLTGYCYEPTKVPVLNDKNPDMYILQDVIENLLCYDFFPNGSLERILDDKSCELDWQTRHKIIRGICEGLHHLHVGCQDAPIVHEGIKPTNILLDDGMVPKLGDFCTSMAVTPRGYIAPEVMGTGEATIRSNIYSLGVLIIEIATGDRCPSDESSGRSYIENALKSWKQGSYVASKYPSLQAGFVQQVECWINIGLNCVEILPERRPTIGQIMHFLDTESTNPECYEYVEFSLSAGSSITAWSSSEMGDHANELDALESMLCDASVEPTKLSYTLLKLVTRNFYRLIGHGGFGAVYLGVLPKGKVAVKKLSILQDLSNTAFMDEILCLKKARHSNVVRLLGYCAVAEGQLMEANGTHVMAERTEMLLCFEYVPNGDLQNYIKEECRGHEWQVRYQIIKGICHGLHYLHKQRISHLDLKPGNVLLDANMEPKITDFGLSRFLAEGKSIIVTKQAFGTRGSIAPELINSGEISFKSDIYGLGVIITKLLTRDNNYDFDNWHKSLEVGCSQEKMCVELARRCVEYDQHKRPTIDEIIRELNEMENTIQEEEPPIIQ
ncbi:uncharacterized protein [Aegilops tauschii subsp. strangulata]|nr:tyrosine-protein kinase JAK2 isoform X2 [Aegilops tauschii subsp. strangulata]